MVGRTSVEKKSGGDSGAYGTFRFTDETDENVGNAMIIPLADMTPPKHMAHIMSQMVSIMPRIPRVATSASISGCPVDKEVLPNTEVIKALNPVVKSRVSPCAICRRI